MKDGYLLHSMRRGTAGEEKPLVQVYTEVTSVEVWGKSGPHFLLHSVRGCLSATCVVWGVSRSDRQMQIHSSFVSNFFFSCAMLRCYHLLLGYLRFWEDIFMQGYLFTLLMSFCRRMSTEYSYFSISLMYTHLQLLQFHIINHIHSPLWFIPFLSLLKNVLSLPKTQLEYYFLHSVF